MTNCQNDDNETNPNFNIGFRLELLLRKQISAYVGRLGRMDQVKMISSVFLAFPFFATNFSEF